MNGPVADAALDRHQAVRDAARWLDVGSVLSGRQRDVAQCFTSFALTLLDLVHRDDPELTRALVALTQAKDHAVRASLAAESASW